MIMTAGLSSYLGSIATEQVKLDNAARELNEKAKRARFEFILRKYARQHGLDISNLVQGHRHRVESLFLNCSVVSY